MRNKNNQSFESLYNSLFNDEKEKFLGATVSSILVRIGTEDSSMDFFAMNKKRLRDRMQDGCRKEFCKLMTIQYKKCHINGYVEDLLTLWAAADGLMLKSRDDRRSRKSKNSSKYNDELVNELLACMKTVLDDIWDRGHGAKKTGSQCSLSREEYRLTDAEYQGIIKSIRRKGLYDKIAPALLYRDGKENIGLDRKIIGLKTDSTIIEILLRLEQMNIRPNMTILDTLSDELAAEYDSMRADLGIYIKSVIQKNREVLSFTGKQEEAYMKEVMNAYINLTGLINARLENLSIVTIDDPDIVLDALMKMANILTRVMLFFSDDRYSVIFPTENIRVLRETKLFFRNLLTLSDGPLPSLGESIFGFMRMYQSGKGKRDDFYAAFEFIKGVDEVAPKNFYEMLYALSISETYPQKRDEPGSGEPSDDMFLNVSVESSENDIRDLIAGLDENIRYEYFSFDSINRLLRSIPSHAARGMSSMHYNDLLMSLDVLLKKMIDRPEYTNTHTVILTMDAIDSILATRKSPSNIDSMLVDHLNAYLETATYGTQYYALKVLNAVASNGTVNNSTVNRIVGSKQTSVRMSNGIYYPGVVPNDIDVSRISMELMSKALGNTQFRNDEEKEAVESYLIRMMMCPDTYTCTLAVDSFSQIALKTSVKNTFDLFRVFIDLLERKGGDDELVISIAKTAYYVSNMWKKISDRERKEGVAYIPPRLQAKFVDILRDQNAAYSHFWVARALGATMKVQTETDEKREYTAILLETLCDLIRGRDIIEGVDETSVREFYQTITTCVKRYGARPEDNLGIRMHIKGLFSECRAQIDNGTVRWGEVNGLCKMTEMMLNVGVWKDAELKKDTDDFSVASLILTLSYITRNTDDTSVMHWCMRGIIPLLGYLATYDGELDATTEKGILDMINVMIRVRSRFGGSQTYGRNSSREVDHGVRIGATAVIRETFMLRIVPRSKFPPESFDTEGDPTSQVQKNAISALEDRDEDPDMEIAVIDNEPADMTDAPAQDANRNDFKKIVRRLGNDPYNVELKTRQMEQLRDLLENMDPNDISELGGDLKNAFLGIVEQMRIQAKLHKIYEQGMLDSDAYDYTIITDACKTLALIVSSYDSKNLEEFERNLHMLEMFTYIIKKMPDYGAIKHSARVIEELAQKGVTNEHVLKAAFDLWGPGHNIRDPSIRRSIAKAVGAIIGYNLRSQRDLILCLYASGNTEEKSESAPLSILMRNLDDEDMNDGELAYWVSKTIYEISEADPGIISEMPGAVGLLFEKLDSDNSTIRLKVAKAISNFTSRGNTKDTALISTYLGLETDVMNDRDRQVNKVKLLKKIDGLSQLADQKYIFDSSEMDAILEFSGKCERSFKTTSDGTEYDELMKKLKICKFKVLSSSHVTGIGREGADLMLTDLIKEALKDQSMFSEFTHTVLDNLAKDPFLVGWVDHRREVFRGIELKPFFRFATDMVRRTCAADGWGYDIAKLDPTSETSLSPYAFDILCNTLDIVYHLIRNPEFKGILSDEEKYALGALKKAVSEATDMEAFGEKRMSRTRGRAYDSYYVLAESVVEKSLRFLYVAFENYTSIYYDYRRVLEIVSPYAHRGDNTSIMFFALHIINSVLSKIDIKSIGKIRGAVEDVLLRIKNEGLLFYYGDTGFIDQSMRIMNNAARKNIFITSLYEDMKSFILHDSNEYPEQLRLTSEWLIHQVKTLIEAVGHYENETSGGFDLHIDEYVCLLDALEYLGTRFNAVLNNNGVKDEDKNPIERERDRLAVALTKLDEQQERILNMLLHNISNTGQEDADDREGTGNDLAMIVSQFSDILENMRIGPKLSQLLSAISRPPHRYNYIMALHSISACSDNTKVDLNRQEIIGNLCDAFRKIKRPKHILDVISEIILNLSSDTLGAQENVLMAQKEVIQLCLDERIFYSTCNNLLEANNKTKHSQAKVRLNSYLMILERMMELDKDKFFSTASRFLEILHGSIGNVDYENDKYRLETIIEKIMNITDSEINPDALRIERNLMQIITSIYDPKKESLPVDCIRAFYENAKRDGSLGDIAVAYQTMSLFRPETTPHLHDTLDVTLRYKPLGTYKPYFTNTSDKEKLDYNLALADFFCRMAEVGVFNKDVLPIFNELLSLETQDADDMKISSIRGIHAYSKNKKHDKDSERILVSILLNECEIGAPSKKKEIEIYAANILKNMIEDEVIKERDLNHEVKIRLDTLVRK